MPVPEIFRALRLPVIASPMFIVSGAELVVAECRAGIVGSFPALNARPQPEFDTWLSRIEDSFAGQPPPYAVNLICHASNDRLAGDIETCVRHRVPLLLTSLQAPDEVVRAAHSYGGLVFHDVTTLRHAEKAAGMGVDGLILVCAGAGGHGGATSPFALLGEIRRFFTGTIVLAGAITSGGDILAAQAMGADMVYMGTRFIATEEANAAADYKAMIVASGAADIVYTNAITGVHGNYLRPTLVRAGLDPENLPINDPSNMNFAEGKPKAWKDIWGSGQGIGAVKSVVPAAGLVDRLEREYRAARARLAL